MITATQIIFGLGALAIAIGEAIFVWLIVTATDDMPRIRKADSSDGEVEHG